MSTPGAVAAASQYCAAASAAVALSRYVMVNACKHFLL